MKRIIPILFLLPLFLYACQSAEIDELFDQSPEKRVSGPLKQMQDELVNTPHGWSVYYNYGKKMENENYFNIVFKNGGEAVIAYPAEGGSVAYHTTTYTLRYAQQIDLVFDTYSVFADLVGEKKGGDFRFEFDKRDAGKIYFNNRNDKTEGEGILELTQAKTANEYPDLVKILGKMIDDPTKSFYRVLNVDGSTEKMLLNVSSMKEAWLTKNVAGEIVSEKHELSMTADGFKLAKPIPVGNVSVSKFVAKDDGSFEAWSETAKVGVLNYGAKPFSYPGTVEKLKELMTNEFFMAGQYSSVFTPMVDRLKKKDPAFTAFQFYTGHKIIVYYRGENEPRWIMYPMAFTLGDDTIKMVSTGSGDKDAVAYKDNAQETFNELNGKTFTVIPIDGKHFFFVQDENPAIWMIIKPI